jgi:hypothetical protein
VSREDGGAVAQFLKQTEVLTIEMCVAHGKPSIGRSRRQGVLFILSRFFSQMAQIMILICVAPYTLTFFQNVEKQMITSVFVAERELFH